MSLLFVHHKEGVKRDLIYRVAIDQQSTQLKILYDYKVERSWRLFAYRSSRIVVHKRASSAAIGRTGGYCIGKS